MAINSGRKPIISAEFALEHGLTIESLPDYCDRVHISKSGAKHRIKRSLAYGFKVGGHWFIVSKNGQDLSGIVT